MQQMINFFGEILRKTDLDFMNLGIRESINNIHIDITNSNGGIISGLNVYSSANGLSLFVTQGSFYNGGIFNTTNGIGGGEKGIIYSPQTFTSLTPTGLVGNNQTYILVYVTTSSQNISPNPTDPQVVYSATNIQTGENQPVRSYNVASIILSNPIVISEVSNFAGVPLALVQTDQNGFIVSIDTSIRKNYIIGGAVDVVQQQILPQAIPDDFVVTRMIGDAQIIGQNFSNGAVTSPALAVWDGISPNYSSSGTMIGSGVSTAHLKAGAVTYPILDYSGSVAGFSTRNRLTNSSFEFDPVQLIGWNILSGTNFVSPTNVAINSPGVPNPSVKFGSQSASLTGGSIPGIGALNVGISQTVDFADNLNGKPITAFVFFQPATSFNLAVSGTTGIQGQLDFISFGGTIAQTVVFDSYSGTSTSWQTLTTTSPIIPNVDCRAVTLTISGAFDDIVYIDGAFLGMTSLVPEWDVNPEELVSNLNASSITSGQFTSAFIANGAINTAQIRNADGTVNTSAGSGIVSSQIQQGTITGANIANGTIQASNLNPSILAVPIGSIIMWDDSISVGCPTGWNDVTTKFAGRFPLGYNTGVGTAIPNPGQASTAQAVGNVAHDGQIGIQDIPVGDHAHSLPGGTNGVGGSASNVPINSSPTGPAGGHAHQEVVPYYTVRFCQKS